MWGAAGGGLLVGLLGRAAGEGLSGGAVGHYAFVSAFAEKPQYSAHTGRSEECLQFPGSRKALGNSGSRLEAQKKKLATQGTQLTAPVFKRQFHKRRGSLRDRLDECWRLLRKKMPQGPTGSRPGAYGHTERDAGPTRGISSTPSPTQVQLLY